MGSLFNYFPKVVATLSHEVRSQTKGEVSIGMSGGETITIIMPQPASESELKMLDPGERLQNFKVTWTKATVVPRDQITHDGTVYRVHQVNDRHEFRRVVMREAVANVA
jgi:hypothetical protein